MHTYLEYLITSLFALTRAAVQIYNLISAKAGASPVGQPFTSGDRAHHSTKLSCARALYITSAHARTWSHTLSFSSVSSTTSIQVQAARPRTYVHVQAGRGPFNLTGSNETAGSMDRGSTYPWSNGPGVQLYSDTVLENELYIAIHRKLLLRCIQVQLPVI